MLYTIELKFAIVVTGAMTALLILGMSVAALPVPVTAQGSLGRGGDPTSFSGVSKNAYDRSHEGLKDGQFASSIDANKYDSSGYNLCGTSVEL